MKKGVNMVSEIIVIDVETTGIKPENSEIIGVSAVLLQDNVFTGFSFETWCEPETRISDEVSVLLNKKPEFFEDRPKILETVRNLELFVNETVLVAKNPEFCSEFLKNAGFSRCMEITDVLDIIRKNIDGMAPYDYDDFDWTMWNEPLKRIMPCCLHLDDDFDTVLIAKLIEISSNSNLRSQLESAGWFDD